MLLPYGTENHTTYELTHLDQNKMATTLQTFSNGFNGFKKC